VRVGGCSRACAGAAGCCVHRARVCRCGVGALERPRPGHHARPHARTLGSQAGYRVKWDAQRNFLIGAPDSVDGTFEAALKSVLNSAGIRQSDYPLEACIYANTPPLVRITRQGEQARECDAQ
jgi:hypothetical protein